MLSIDVPFYSKRPVVFDLSPFPQYFMYLAREIPLSTVKNGWSYGRQRTTTPPFSPPKYRNNNSSSLSAAPWQPSTIPKVFKLRLSVLTSPIEGAHAAIMHVAARFWRTTVWCVFASVKL